jgi:outer membrane receptor protein involved in Fe transport
LDVSAAYRYSDFSTVGGLDNYKIDFSYAPIDSLRFRGSFSTASRAPNIGELFSPQGEGFPGSKDPCAAEGNPTADVAAICQATGVAASDVGSPALNLPAGQVRQLSGGNPDLEQEDADTYTLGVVFTPSVIDGLSVSVDYFDIEIEGYIASFGGGANNVLNTCYDPASAFGGIGSQFCDVVSRRADGTIESVSVTSQNVAGQTLTGFDVQAQYVLEGLGGTWALNYLATFTEESDFTPFDGADTIECAGKFGQDCGEPLPEYNHRATVNYARNNWTAQVVWRHIGSTDDDDENNTYFVEKLDSEDYIDASARYEFSNGMSLMAGVDNLMDSNPPILGDNQEQANTYPATYDVFGRTYFVRFGWEM